MTKPITSAALMTLYEEGRFQLSDPVHLYLGESWKKANMSVWVSGHPKEGARGDLVVEPCKKTITIADVLTHTSGLSYGFDPIGNPVDALYSNALDSEETSLLEWAEQLAKLPLFFQPQSAWHYGYNTDICGALVEAISGMKFAEYLLHRTLLVNKRAIKTVRYVSIAMMDPDLTGINLWTGTYASGCLSHLGWSTQVSGCHRRNATDWPMCTRKVRRDQSVKRWST
jgi:hypothetical protein